VAKLVFHGAMLRCSEGLAPGSLVVLPANMTNGEDKPVATVMDHLPMVNIQAFGMCKSMANPQVAAATASASGVLTPQPCIPLTAAPWTPGAPAVTVQGMTVLVEGSTCMCTWAGTIEIADPSNAAVTEG